MLTGETAAVEEGLFFRRGLAPEHLVAVGEAAEAADDVGVQLRPLQKFGVTSRREQRAAMLLVGQMFGVLERQIEELFVSDGAAAVEAAALRPQRR